MGGLFFAKGERSNPNLPVFGEDLDFRGTKTTCALLKIMFQGAGGEVSAIIVASRRNGPSLGRVFAVSISWRGHKTSIEVLERLPGLDTGIEDDLVGSSLNPVDGLTLCVPSMGAVLTGFKSPV